MVVPKAQLETQLKEEHKLIKEGVLRDDSPLDQSIAFQELCYACRVGDLKACQEAIASGVNINARDLFDYTPLILASLCGHYEAVELLLESGALCERDTFQGERCLYNALNNRIRNLLLQYDYSKSTDPLQPLASHITSLLSRQSPITTDLSLTTGSEAWNAHKFILSARSPYFRSKLAAAPGVTTLKVANTIPPEAFNVALRYLYLGEIPSDLGPSSNSSVSEEDILKGINKISVDLQIESLWGRILEDNDRRIARQRHQDDITRGRDQMEEWFKENVLRYKIQISTSKASEVKWTLDNGVFADVLLRADELEEEVDEETRTTEASKIVEATIPIGPLALPNTSTPLTLQKPRQSVLYPVHRAMLLRSDYFQTMFTSAFSESRLGEHLKIITVDCTPAVLEVILYFLYTETAEIPLPLALDVLYAADMLFIEKLKTKAAIIISTVGNGSTNLADRTHVEDGEVEVEVEDINIYDVIKASWDLKIQRLEVFSARYLAYRLEDYIDEQDFEDLIKESAARIEKRQETDSIELLDDIRHYLSQRFQLRFEDSGLEEIMDVQESSAANEPGAKVVDEGVDTDYPAEELAAKMNDLAVDAAVYGQIRTLDGEIAGDVFEQDAINYRILLEKIDQLLDRLKLDA